MERPWPVTVSNFDLKIDANIFAPPVLPHPRPYTPPPVARATALRNFSDCGAQPQHRPEPSTKGNVTQPNLLTQPHVRSLHSIETPSFPDTLGYGWSPNNLNPQVCYSNDGFADNQTSFQQPLWPLPNDIKCYFGAQDIVYNMQHAFDSFSLASNQSGVATPFGDVQTHCPDTFGSSDIPATSLSSVDVMESNYDPHIQGKDHWYIKLEESSPHAFVARPLSTADSHSRPGGLEHFVPEVCLSRDTI